MAKPALLALLGISTYLSSLVAAIDARPPPFSIDVGHFKFPLNDPNIVKEIEQTEANLTQWQKFRNETHTYWFSHDQPLPDDIEIEALHKFGEKHQIDQDEVRLLIERAKEEWDAALQAAGNDSTKLWNSTHHVDLSEKFLDEIDEEFKYLHHRKLAAFAGVGSPSDCSAHILATLDEMDEWEKSGMAASSTLMALLPTFLAFGSLFVPRSSEAFATSWLIGLGAALFSLGLPVKSLSCIRRRQVLELSTLDKHPVDIIAALGARDDTELEEENPELAAEVKKDGLRTLKELKKWTGEAPEPYMREFVRIRRAVEGYKERWHWWHVPAALIAGVQGFIFGFCIEPLLRAAGIPKFIFACAGVNWTGLYLSISAAANAIFRLAMWQLCDHEIVNIYSLSTDARTHLESLVSEIAQDPSHKTTANELPPLYPPLISAFHTRTGNLINKVFPSWTPLQPEHPPGAFLQTVRESLEYTSSVLKTPLTLLSSGFTDTDAAPRWRPLVVLIHLSTQGRPQLRTLFTGFCEAALLLALTFFFASQWGGNLYITSIALGLLLVFITVGRALAIVYVWLSARTWGLHSINCDEQDEILGCLRIVCSMQNVLVVVNGAHYFNGVRLDYDKEGFRNWKKSYTSGDFDEKKLGARMKKSASVTTAQISVQAKESAEKVRGSDIV